MSSETFRPDPSCPAGALNQTDVFAVHGADVDPAVGEDSADPEVLADAMAK